MSKDGLNEEVDYYGTYRSESEVQNQTWEIKVTAHIPIDILFLFAQKLSNTSCFLHNCTYA